MIYFPVTCDILTPGHIKCFRWLQEKDEVIIGLLTGEALEGYKDAVVPYTQRLFVLEAVTDIKIVPQTKLDPKENLIKYKCDKIASGDGWEDVELDAMKELGVEPVNIELPGRRYSSSEIKRIIARKLK